MRREELPSSQGGDECKPNGVHQWRLSQSKAAWSLLCRLAAQQLAASGAHRRRLSGSSGGAGRSGRLRHRARRLLLSGWLLLRSRSAGSLRPSGSGHRLLGSGLGTGLGSGSSSRWLLLCRLLGSGLRSGGRGCWLLGWLLGGGHRSGSSGSRGCSRLRGGRLLGGRHRSSSGSHGCSRLLCGHLGAGLGQRGRSSCRGLACVGRDHLGHGRRSGRRSGRHQGSRSGASASTRLQGCICLGGELLDAEGPLALPAAIGADGVIFRVERGAVLAVGGEAARGPVHGHALCG